MAIIADDVTVRLGEDRPGVLAEALEAVAKAKINLDGFAEIEGILHLLTADGAVTRHALEAAGLAVTSTQPVLVVETEDKPGVAAGICRRIASAGINVSFAYMATRTRMVIGAEDARRAAEAL
ncbi:MAG: hypothetical protein HY654_14400 [Acidobacteria bacterium]|nr:hypothetical protein [Acidobacteriota bacterium]